MDLCPSVAVAGDVNFEELARSCDDFNGAQLKAVCVEAGMLALRREAEQVSPELSYPVTAAQAVYSNAAGVL